MNVKAKRPSKAERQRALAELLYSLLSEAEEFSWPKGFFYEGWPEIDNLREYLERDFLELK